MLLCGALGRSLLLGHSVGIRRPGRPSKPERGAGGVGVAAACCSRPRDGLQRARRPLDGLGLGVSMQ
eukprot:9208847-Pyramimonas_sp.AAC.1